MRRMLGGVAIGLTIVNASQAQAQAPTPATDCAARIGTTLNVQTFEEASGGFASGADLERDEFETTEAFDARRAAAWGSVPSSVAVSVPFFPDVLAEYDADRREFSIHPLTFNEHSTSWFHALAGTGIAPGVSQIAVGLGEDEYATGTYTASNAYGASWEVTKVTKVALAIFERPVDFGQGRGLFGLTSATAPMGPFIKLPIAPEEARALKPRLRAAVLYEPREPYFVNNVRAVGNAVTPTSPYEMTLHAKVLIGDIRCAFITDDNGYVLLAMTTL